MKRKIIILFIGVLLLCTSNMFSKNYAIIIIGDTPDLSSNSPTKNWSNAQHYTENPFADAFWNDTYTMWETLYSMGFENDDIFVLFGDGSDYYGSGTYNRYFVTQQFPFSGITGITDFSANLQDVNNIFNWLKNGNPSVISL